MRKSMWIREVHKVEPINVEGTTCSLCGKIKQMYPVTGVDKDGQEFMFFRKKKPFLFKVHDKYGYVVLCGCCIKEKDIILEDFLPEKAEKDTILRKRW